MLQWLGSALSVLRTLAANDFAQTADSVPQPYVDSPPLAGDLFDLEAILVPPEVEDEGAETSRKGEWPQCYVRLFDDDVRLLAQISINPKANIPPTDHPGSYDPGRVYPAL